jgi:hypothetical protein
LSNKFFQTRARARARVDRHFSFGQKQARLKASAKFSGFLLLENAPVFTKKNFIF